MSDFILAVAPTGARKTRADHPALPITPAELAACAIESRDAGAAMMHLHVRRADGRHSLEADDYRKAIDAIRAAVGQDLVIQVTTESAGIYTPDRQMAIIRALQPEAASIALGEIAPDVAHEREAATFFAWMHGASVIAQFILYDAGDVRRYFDLRDRGVIAADRHWMLFVLGRYAEGQRAEPNDMLGFLDAWHARADLSAHVPWMLCAFGPRELECAAQAISLGGHARIGFENNVHLADGTIAPNNESLIRDFVALASSAKHRPVSGTGLRARFAHT